MMIRLLHLLLAASAWLAPARGAAEDSEGGKDLWALQPIGRFAPPVTRASHDSTRRCSRVLAAMEDQLSVDQHIADAGCILVRLIKRGMILDRCRIEDDNVRKIAGLQQASLTDAKIVGRESRQFMNGGF